MWLAVASIAVGACSSSDSATPTTVVVSLPVSTDVVDTTLLSAPSSSVPSIVAEADVPVAPPTVLTPVVGLARSRFAVPGLGALALGSALGVMEISRRPRRRLDGDSDELDLPMSPGARP